VTTVDSTFESSALEGKPQASRFHRDSLNAIYMQQDPTTQFFPENLTAQSELSSINVAQRL